jgi:hypothetical protein
MKKHRIERNLLFPSREFRDRVRSAASDRGFRSEQAFILTACEHELRQGDNTEATAQLEARIAATLGEHGEGGTVPLHFGPHTSCPHKFTVAVRFDLRD